MTIKYSKEVSEFIEANASASDDGYYWFPNYFKKVGDCLFEITEWKDLPGELKHIVERSENPNPDKKEGEG